ncbi:MAG: ATP-binding cassette domain-containing protein, partial [Gammaproteobacteria bacterium]
MAQYVYTMKRVSKIVPPKRVLLRDISLSFFPGAKIGVLGLNGAGKSTLLKIMAGLDKEIEGEAIPMPGLKIGYLPQEPQLDPDKDVRGNVEEGLAEIKQALARLEEVYAAYAEPDADFELLAKKQEKLEKFIEAHDGHDLDRQLEIAADALRLPPWEADVTKLSGGERRRVALCRLLLQKPDMLLLDEPTN